MNVARLATAFSIIGGLFIIYVGVSYLFLPEATASGFGLPAWPAGDAAGFLNVKGVRDIGTGVVILALLAAKQRYALAITTLAMALIPFGDMLTILRWDGSTTIALSVHGLTAAFVALTGALLLWERRTTQVPVAA
ncbi:DUF4267 domain-containing protein [Nocardia goodfellowii]|uniref:Small membrane hydrophobic protein n=1 Tax=Nocardia goodfellowii TaxID=882446 RepID=A0ABS4QCJ7_9NOCA|nr:DUF4267 domain-containing protein [Nocardia goodfellowii]MBP2189409.1 hypothetical protein [Nocardia goodfellowii]